MGSWAIYLLVWAFWHSRLKSRRNVNRWVVGLVIRGARGFLISLSREACVRVEGRSSYSPALLNYFPALTCLLCVKQVPTKLKPWGFTASCALLPPPGCLGILGGGPTGILERAKQHNNQGSMHPSGEASNMCRGAINKSTWSLAWLSPQTRLHAIWLWCSMKKALP